MSANEDEASSPERIHDQIGKHVKASVWEWDVKRRGNRSVNEGEVSSPEGIHEQIWKRVKAFLIIMTMRISKLLSNAKRRKAPKQHPGCTPRYWSEFKIRQCKQYEPRRYWETHPAIVDIRKYFVTAIDIPRISEKRYPMGGVLRRHASYQRKKLNPIWLSELIRRIYIRVKKPGRTKLVAIKWPLEHISIHRLDNWTV